MTLSTGAFTYNYFPTGDPAVGKLQRITAPDGGTLNYTYDGALLDQTTWGGIVAGNVGRTHNSDLQIDSLSVNGATAISFVYDNDGLLKQAGALAVDQKVTGGRWTRSTAIGNVTDISHYTGFSEVKDYTAAYKGSEVFKILFSNYDRLGRITDKTETVAGVATIFHYDYGVAGRLWKVTTNGTLTATYTYDLNGNRLTAPGLTTAPTYDAQDRLTQYVGTAYSYTANGELKTNTVGASVSNYDYDVLGNLKHVTLPDGTLIDYVVDGWSRRLGKKVNGTLQQGFLYQDGFKPIAELDGANQVVSRFVYATHVNVPDYMVKSGVVYRIIADNLGSPRLVVDTTTGAPAQEMDYDEFGNVIKDTAHGFQPFGFAGGLYDSDTKLVRFGVRDYDATTGRWTAKDPILFAGDNTNLYSYVKNDPVNLIDRSGLQVDSMSASGLTFTASGEIVTAAEAAAAAAAAGAAAASASNRNTTETIPSCQAPSMGKKMTPDCELLLAAGQARCSSMSSAVSRAACRGALITAYLICKFKPGSH